MATIQGKSFDDIVIGSGLAGVLIARQLKSQGRNVLVVEEKSTFGGRIATGNMDGYEFEHRLRVIPDQEETRSALEQAQSHFPGKVSFQAETQEILTFNGLKRAPFVGFGDLAPDYYDVILPYLSDKTLRLDQSPHSWIADQAEVLNVAMQSTVTGLQLDGSVLVSAEINGAKTLKAENFYYTGHPQNLLDLLPTQALPQKMGQRIGRLKTWTSIGLDVLFGVNSCDFSRLLLPGTKNENFPAVASFETSGEKLLGQFLTFVPGNESSDGEVCGNAVRRIHKQIKKYLPELFASIISERVTVSPQSHTLFDSGLRLSGAVEGVNGLHVAHRSIGASALFPAEILSAVECLPSQLEASGEFQESMASAEL